MNSKSKKKNQHLTPYLLKIKWSNNLLFLVPHSDLYFL